MFFFQIIELLKNIYRIPNSHWKLTNLAVLWSGMGVLAYNSGSWSTLATTPDDIRGARLLLVPTNKATLKVHCGDCEAAE